MIQSPPYVSVEPVYHGRGASFVGFPWARGKRFSRIFRFRAEIGASLTEFCLILQEFAMKISNLRA
jgi:hypothetical protein